MYKFLIRVDQGRRLFLQVRTLELISKDRNLAESVHLWQSQAKILHFPPDSIYFFLELGHVHCKYIQCNFYSFFLYPTFHCNPTVLFTFNCCFSGINVTLIYCKIYTSTLYCVWQILVQCTFFPCVPLSTVISLYRFAV